jgi:tetratricopeptide (TPR) repeat protein
MNMPQKALDQYNSIFQSPGIKPEDAARAKCEIGEVYAYQNDTVNARANFLIVQSQYPQVSNWVIISEYSLAMLDYQQWLSHPDSIHYAICYQELNKFVTDNPTDHHTPQALKALADCYMGGGKYNEAINAYERIIQYDSTKIPVTQRSKNKHNNLTAHKSLVKDAMLSKAKLLRANTKNPNEAIAIYDNLLSSDQNNEELLINKSLCLIDLGQKAEAKTILNQIVQSGGKEKGRAKHILQKLQ